LALFNVVVASGVVMTVAASKINDTAAGIVSGAGSVVITGLDAAAHDLSNITAAASAEVGTLTLNGGTDLGTVAVTVSRGDTLTLSAAQASGKTITGEASEDTPVDAADAGGSVIVTGLGATAVDLSGIVAGAATEVGDTAGSLTAQVSSTVTLAAGTNLGGFDVAVSGANTLTVTAAQANGRAITAAAGGIEVTNLVNGTSYDFGDLTGGTVRLNVTSNLNLATSDLGGVTTIQTDGGPLDAFVVTLTANQADGLGLDANGTSSSFTTTAIVDADAIGVDITGGANGDNLSGSDDTDVIRGGAGNDVINGGAGADEIRGGTGVDQLTGGSGDDEFVFGANSTGLGALRDVVLDFEGASFLGGDLIDINAITSGATLWRGTSAFGGGNSGNSEVRYGLDGDNAILEIDIDDNGVADLQIQINNVSLLNDDDFVL
jgi:Ca2+-binding RTX toxin-like protein